MEIKDHKEELEIWKDIPDWEGFYQVSNYGRVRSVTRFAPHRKTGFAKRKGVLLKITIDKLGYCKACVTKNNNSKQISVHRAMMSAFIGVSDLHIDHLNGIKSDNRLENLEYVTNRENTSRYYQSKGKELPTGVTKRRNNYMAKIVVGGKTWQLGTYRLIQEASDIYQAALADTENIEKYVPKKKTRIRSYGSEQV
jgi:isocitrate/isopropylmalate dehydrogenase